MVDYKGQPQQKHRPDHTPAPEQAGPSGPMPAGPAGNSILGLQRTIGNKAVRRELASPALSPQMILAQQQTLGNKAVQRLLRARALQAKLTVTAPDDAYEQEADQVADSVMRMPEPSPAVADGPAAVQRRVGPSDQPAGPFEVEPALEGQIGALQGGGDPLPEAERAFFEPRFGQDFSQVRVHADGQAAGLARAVDARAFTVGSSVAFGAGEYAPGTPAGRQLLAHELTHVVQQTGGQAAVAPSRRPDAALTFQPVNGAGPVSGGYIGWPAMHLQRKGQKGATPTTGLPGLEPADFDVPGPAPGGKGHKRGGTSLPPAPGAAPAEGAPQPKLEELLKAAVEFGTFTSSNYAFPNFKVGLNGNFDVNYQPAAKTLGITVKVGFKFFDDPVDKSAAGKWAQGDKDSYASGFLNKVTAAWNDRYTFKNVREPQAVWKSLNPVHVSLSVVDVSKAGAKASKGQHFLVQPHKEAASGANFTAVSGGKLNLYKGDDQTQSPFFQTDATAGELARLAMANPSPILFDNDSAKVKAADKPKLEFLATYLKRINQPKFDVKIVGHASNTGQNPYNLKLSEKRAKAVEDVLKTGGVTNHNLLPSAVGETGAKAGPEWRKVEIIPSVVAGYVNAFDTFPHEFGHMLGLGDEYQTATSPGLTTHYDLVKKAFGKEYADIVAKRGASGGGTTGQSAIVMDVGQDLRIYDYVTFWSALAETTLNKAASPTPRFGYEDWKFNE